MGPKRLQGPCDSYLGEGLRALAKGENSLAAEAFYKAFETDPTRIDALKYMCEALLAEESYDQAVQIYEMLVEMDRQDHLSRFNLAVVYSRLKRFGEAEQVYAELLCERQDYVRARYNLAVLYQGQGKLSEAAKQWQEVIRQSPDLSSARACLGQVYLDLGQARRAMLQYAEAAKLRPKEAGAWTNLAEASKAAGFLGRAHVAMQRAVELSSEDAGLWRRLGQLQLQLHRSTGRRELLDCACESWQRSLSLDGNQQDVRDWLETYRTPRPATKPGK